MKGKGYAQFLAVLDDLHHARVAVFDDPVKEIGTIYFIDKNKKVLLSNLGHKKWKEHKIKETIGDKEWVTFT